MFSQSCNTDDSIEPEPKDSTKTEINQDSVRLIKGGFTKIQRDSIIAKMNAIRQGGCHCTEIDNASKKIWYPPTTALQWDSTIEKATLMHSKDMAKRNYLGHYSPEGVGPFERLEQVGFTNFNYVRENCANTASIKDFRQAYLLWIKSDQGHCSNMMDPKLTRFALSKRKSSTNKNYWTLKMTP
ncbi:MAG: CAP domain-containing protein, partial [Bacteroidia bacterium]